MICLNDWNGKSSSNGAEISVRLSPYDYCSESDIFTDSDIIHLSVAGKSIIVIDKYETAMELLNKRAAIYSNRYVLHELLIRVSDLMFCRPDMPMMELMGDWQSFNIPFMVYGELIMLVSSCHF